MALGGHIKTEHGKDKSPKGVPGGRKTAKEYSKRIRRRHDKEQVRKELENVRR